MSMMPSSPVISFAPATTAVIAITT